MSVRSHDLYRLHTVTHWAFILWGVPTIKTPLSLCQLRVKTYIDSTLFHIEHLFADESQQLRLLSVIISCESWPIRLHTVTSYNFSESWQLDSSQFLSVMSHDLYWFHTIKGRNFSDQSWLLLSSCQFWVTTCPDSILFNWTLLGWVGT